MMLALVYLLGIASGACAGRWFALNSKEQWRRLDDEYGYEDPGECLTCGMPWQMVRPGKSQPNCRCYDLEAVPSPSGETEGRTKP